MSYRRLAWLAALAFAVVALGAPSAPAHELWIEADARGKIAEPARIDVSWGHSGERTPGEMLRRQASRLSGSFVAPDGTAHALTFTVGDDRFETTLTPKSAGCHVIGAELQSGIIDKEFHGIPANTRIVMYGKAVTRVGASNEGSGNTLGFDLEIVPVSDPGDLHPGDVVTVKLLLRGKPVGGREVILSLRTAGPQAPPDDPRLQSTQWAIEGHPDPRTGEVSFPLIVAGPHLFSIRYLDETPGTYRGDVQYATEFSHLRKGDQFERTMYMATFSMDVGAK